jgi:hypothetical protein
VTLLSACCMLVLLLFHSTFSLHSTGYHRDPLRSCCPLLLYSFMSATSPLPMLFLASALTGSGPT